MALIPADWLTPASMTRVITHWTAGTYTATQNAKEHYHILIDGDGVLHRGTKTIKDNEGTGDGVYAAHTLNANTKSIGVSVCCMHNATESPFNGGSYPMKEIQWYTMARVVGELCAFYKIAVSPQTVLGHGEVQSILGIAQTGKWDPMVLPWDTAKTKAQVGDAFRAAVGLSMTVDAVAAAIGGMVSSALSVFR